MNAKQIHLTALEAQVIEHRSGAPDCIVETLGYEGYDAEVVSDVADQINIAVSRLCKRGGILDLEPILFKHDAAVVAKVLADIVEGETITADAMDSMESERRAAALFRAVDNLADKIEHITGLELVR